MSVFVVFKYYAFVQFLWDSRVEDDEVEGHASSNTTEGINKQ